MSQLHASSFGSFQIARYVMVDRSSPANCYVTLAKPSPLNGTNAWKTRKKSLCRRATAHVVRFALGAVSTGLLEVGVNLVPTQHPFRSVEMGGRRQPLVMSRPTMLAAVMAAWSSRTWRTMQRRQFSSPPPRGHLTCQNIRLKSGS